MKLRACCKINIGLDVLRRRSDGYHDLHTVMVPVRGLFDVLDIEPSGCGEDIFSQTGIAVDCQPEQNLCIAAARLMRSRYGIGGMRISLEKRIPFGAGLGGGSSDCTAVIRAADRLFGLGLGDEELARCAAQLGSDTVFFLHDRAQFCQGRGEIMSPAEPLPAGMHLIVAKPAERVSTAAAYRGVKPAVPQVPLLQRLGRPMAEWQQCVVNDFERSVFAQYPRIAQLKESLTAAGAIYASMSGSGSACFGIFGSAEQADAWKPPFGDVFVHREQTGGD